MDSSGVCDIALVALPNMVMMAQNEARTPADGWYRHSAHMVQSPCCAIRGNGYSVPLMEGWETLPISKSEILRRRRRLPHGGIRLGGLPSHGLLNSE